MIHLYKKILLLLGVIFYLCFTASNVWSKSGVDLVEIKLLNDLDDKRGFCIDIKGYKFRAKIKRGIQAHTCYSYQGEIAVDQGLDTKKLKQRQLFFPNFNVCVHPTLYKNRLILNLMKCTETEIFIFGEDNTIRLKNNTNLCLTVGKEPSRKGGGGSPIHLMRNVSMQKCNIQSFIYQTWGIRHFIKGKIVEKKIFSFR